MAIRFAFIFILSYRYRLLPRRRQHRALEVIVLYPFSYFDQMRRKWMRARYRATLDEIAPRYVSARMPFL